MWTFQVTYKNPKTLQLQVFTGTVGYSDRYLAAQSLEVFLRDNKPPEGYKLCDCTIVFLTKQGGKL